MPIRVSQKMMTMRRMIKKVSSKLGKPATEQTLGYNGYEIRPECRLSVDEEPVETTTMTTTIMTTTTTWNPTTTIAEVCRGLNAAELVLPGSRSTIAFMYSTTLF